MAKRMALCLGFVLAGAWMAAGQARADETFVLARDGQAAATIVLARTPTRAAQFAAYELQWHLGQITGGQFQIAREDESVSGPVVLVGDSGRVRALDLEPDSLPAQEYVIRFFPDALVLAGKDKDDRGIVEYDQAPSQHALDTWPMIWDEQGTMYAVYDFLERLCGVRWFNPTEFGTDCPRNPTLSVSRVDVQRAPFMKYRYASYVPPEDYDRYTGLWPAGSDGQRKWEAAAYPDLHRRFEGGAYTFAKRGWNILFRLRHREGGQQCPGNHSLYGYYRRFWAAEPGQEALFEQRRADLFAQGYEGQPPQMCYTSPALVEQVARDACEFFETGKSYPGAQADGDFFCVEPMDNDLFCKCADCQKWLTGCDADSPFFTNGRHSDYFFQFVNEVAKRVGKRHPDKRVVCLAYMTHGAPPQRVALEPNVLVQYCFACNRLNFDRPSYEHEVELLEQWRHAYPDRPLYLWLYYTFPVEIANNGKFHCFPGFFADAIRQQFQLFEQYDYRGVFHCGYGQDVEAYITYRLMDDPHVDVDELLDEYFTRLYGPAADPMRQFYETVQQIYGDPASYPEPIATGRIEGHHHQTQEVAWGNLGTARRMELLGDLMQQAKTAAQTPLEKTRVALFELGTWDYMRAGRQQYLDHVRARAADTSQVLRVPFTSARPDEGKPTQLDAGEALALTGWRSALGEPTRRKVAARLINEGVNLSVQCEEQRDARTIRSTADVVSGDYWQILFAAGPQDDLHELCVNDAGQQRLDGQPSQVAVRTQAGARESIVQLTLPLALLDTAPDGRCYLNLIRRSGTGEDEPMWSPSFGEFTDRAGLRQLTLDTAATIPAQVPAGAAFEQLSAQALVAHWRFDQSAPGATVVSSAGGLSGTIMNKARYTSTPRRALRLEDSKRQFVDFGSPPELDLTGPLTLLVCVQYEPTDVWYPALLGKGYELTGTYGMHIRPGGTVWFEIDAPDGTRHIYNPTDLCVTPGQWCHVAASYDGATMRVYINGREAGAGKPVATAIRTNGEPLRFGWLGSYGFFNGSVREASVYRRALSAAEVFAHYQQSR